MRYHITVSDAAMTKLRKMAKTAKITAADDRELVQAMLHYFTDEPMPKRKGGARRNAGRKPKDADSEKE